MRAYRLTQWNSQGRSVTWFPTLRAAQRRRADYRRWAKARGRDVDAGTISKHDVPTDQAGLLAWLNSLNLLRD